MAQVIQRAYRNYVRYKHESASRIQATYRKWCSIKAFIFKRDQGHQLLNGRKERRRNSLLSMRRFMGDYLGISQGGNKQIASVCGSGFCK
jgi:myosin-1